MADDRITKKKKIKRIIIIIFISSFFFLKWLAWNDVKTNTTASPIKCTHTQPKIKIIKSNQIKERTCGYERTDARTWHGSTNRKRAILQSRLGSCYYYEGRKYKRKKKKTQVYKNILSTAGANDNGLLLFSSRREFISLSEGQCQLGKPTTNAAVPPSPLWHSSTTTNGRGFGKFPTFFLPGKCTERRRTKRQIYSQPRRTYLIAT